MVAFVFNNRRECGLRRIWKWQSGRVRREREKESGSKQDDAVHEFPASDVLHLVGGVTCSHEELEASLSSVL